MPGERRHGSPAQMQEEGSGPPHKPMAGRRPQVQDRVVDGPVQSLLSERPQKSVSDLGGGSSSTGAMQASAILPGLGVLVREWEQDGSREAGESGATNT